MRVAIVALVVALAASGVVYVGYQHRTGRPSHAGPRPNGPIYFLGSAEGPTLFGGSPFLYTVEPDGSRFRQISSGGSLRGASGIAISPDGRWIAFSEGGGEFSPRHIYVMRSDGSGAHQITTSAGPLALRPMPQEGDPAWSPDGGRIVFASTRCCDTEYSLGNRALYLVRPDGSGLRQLTDGSSSIFAPEWSPGGTQIAYIDRAWQIGMMNSDGSTPRPLMAPGLFHFATTWSPDGRYLAYTADNGSGEGWQLRAMRPDGTDDHLVYACEGLCHFGGRSIEWSPDGKEIAFTFARVRGKGFVHHVGLVRPDGSGFRVLDTHGIQPEDISWAAAR